MMPDLEIEGFDVLHFRHNFAVNEEPTSNAKPRGKAIWKFVYKLDADNVCSSFGSNQGYSSHYESKTVE